MGESTKVQRLLLLIKMDAGRIVERLQLRGKESLHILAIKRTREHFDHVFKSKYDTLTIHDLTDCNPEILVMLDQFYSEVEDLKWYFSHSEDQPLMMQDQLTRTLKILETNYANLALYIDAELGLVDALQPDEGFQEPEEISDPPPFIDE